MNAELWKQLDELFLEAMSIAPEGRERYIERVAKGNSHLKYELETLLAQVDDTFLETAPLSFAGGLLPDESPVWRRGESAGDFEIIELLGRGGMGEVYRARDRRLDREVALKFLSAEFARDPIFLDRFQAEARAASALNHPNICTVYDVGEADGQQFIVMELLRGATLNTRVGVEPGRLPEMLDMSIQIAGALVAAHRHGIVHRDIKPGNLFVVDAAGESPQVKILDFGLAKLNSALQAEPGAETRETLGTIAYMSPEQARGLDVDARSDLFSFGIVLYEIATGKPPFAGPNYAGTLRALLQRPAPAASASNPRVPAQLDRIIAKALQKDPALRYQAAADLRDDLKQLRLQIDRKSQSRGRLLALAALGVAALAGVGAWLWPARSTGSSKTGEWQALTNFTDSATNPVLSPDGRSLAFFRGDSTFGGRGELYLKRLPDGEPVALADDKLQKVSLAFSPDGSQIVYGTSWPWDSWTVPVTGGTPKLMLANASGLTWLDKNRILFSEIKSGAHMALVTAGQDRAHERDVYLPAHERGMAHRSALSPNGKWVLLTEMDNAGWLPCRVVPFNGTSQGRKIGPPDGKCTDVAWSPNGHWMYFTSDITGGFHIWRQRFDGGKPEQFTFGPNKEEGIAIASDGKSLITSVGTEQSELWFRSRGQKRRVSSEGYAATPRLTSDARHILYLVRKGENAMRMGTVAGELWSADLVEGTNERLLEGAVVTAFDVSANGKQVVYAREEAGQPSEIWLGSLEGKSPPRRLSQQGDLFPRFGSNGDVYFTATQGNVNYLYRMKLDGTGRQQILKTPILILLGVSPDGRWAFVWGHREDRKEQSRFLLVPTGGGKPLDICRFCNGSWSHDGKLFYLSPDGLDQGQTFLTPFPGAPSPAIVDGTENTAEKLKRVAGVKVIDQFLASPGPDPDTFVYLKVSAHRNLYRVPIP